jgi:L-alanine-DL-glutamate epimerase-like enolase superfamily enzyme
MKIEHIELYHVEVPLTEPFHPSWIPGYPQSFNHFTLIRLTTDDGIVGESAGMTLGKMHAGFGDVLGPFLVGRDPFDIEGFLRVSEAAALLGARLAWVEPALWDIIGKAAGQPVYRLLGGGEARLKAYCSTGELRDADRRAEDLVRLRDKGFAAVKLRFHDFDWRKEIRVVEKARDAIGDSMEIMVDANQGWRAEPLESGPQWDLKTATDVARALEKYDVYWLEEPLDRMDYAGMRELREKTNLRISGAEINARFQEYAALVQNRCLDILQPDATFVGGIAISKKIAGLAQANGLGFAPHTWTNGIGLLVNMHVMAAVPNAGFCEFPYDPPGWTVQARDAILAENIDIDSEGYLQIPDSPGLGIAIDKDKFAKYGEKFFEI